MPAESVPWFDSNQPVLIRVTSTVATALGIPDAEVAVASIQQQSGLLLVTVINSSTQTTRYLIPSTALLYARQQITTSAPTPPQS